MICACGRWRVNPRLESNSVKSFPRLIAGHKQNLESQKGKLHKQVESNLSPIFCHAPMRWAITVNFGIWSDIVDVITRAKFCDNGSGVLEF